MNYSSRTRFLLASLALLALVLTGASRAHAEAKLLMEASTGKVLLAENATYPWYPASTTKLMTTYTVLREVQEGKISLNTMITMTHDAIEQEPSKMGLPVGTRLTIDNALKMMLVKSANDVAVAIAEGVGGSIPKFADLMNANAARLGMTESHFVNPNGLPAEHHYTSARDLGILARALYLEFPQYAHYWGIHSIRYGSRIIRNYNHVLLDSYPGADGMKTGFICASGYNLVASAVRNGRRLIAVVLGAYSGHDRTLQAAKLLERGFDSTPLSWLTPSLGTVDSLAPIDANPPDLRDEMCGPHRHRHAPPSDNDEDSDATASADSGKGDFVLSALRPPNGKFELGPPVDTEPPVVVFTGSPDHPDYGPVYHRHAKKKTVHHRHAKAVKPRHGKSKEKSAKK
ncbi:MAG TPA: D-alanyl-D-alanine carboxypeptidase family protein [Pseudolabrys sp.]|nr:D-alanyl-D-alanine carboxypeptidase family protein [Pseudolabrys sp.]